ncbi:MAG: type II toxin-antitoxin system RelE/ParE family toxin, partial [Coriobacteriia bacterium]|nr:type II toxin-antitoxin system RelE/ParE family toxin [Coriobacteriia bacterium]
VDLSAARKLRTRLLSEIRSLETMPEKFPFINEDFLPFNKYHELFVENWFLILYQIKDNIVFVDYILDCRQDYHWLLDPQ